MLHSLMVDDLAAANVPRYEAVVALHERLYEPFDPAEAKEYRQALAVAKLRAQAPDDVDDETLPTVTVDGAGPIDDPLMELDVD